MSPARTILAAALALSAAACDLSPPRMHYRVFVSPELSAEQAAAVARGLGQWEARSGGLAAFDVVSGASDDGLEDAVVVTASAGDGVHAGMTTREDGNRARVWFSREALAGDLAALERTAAHEGGHVLSLDHAREGEDSVMRTGDMKDSSARRVTCRDVRAACATRSVRACECVLNSQLEVEVIR